MNRCVLPSAVLRENGEPEISAQALQFCELLDYYSGMTDNPPRFVAIPTGTIIFKVMVWDREKQKSVSRHVDIAFAISKARRL